MKQVFSITGRKIGVGNPCFIIAEIGVNHNGQADLACRLVEEAARAGADAVKFQTFSAECLAAADAPLADYQRHGVTASSQREMLRELELAAEDFITLESLCRSLGILFLSTPFDIQSADFLAQLGVSAFKISSGDLNHYPLLRHVASFGKPMLVSTGMSTMGEVRSTFDFLCSHAVGEVALLQCVSCYPARPEQVNLRVMDRFREEFGCPVGFSDHTMGEAVAIAAVARGANVLEKHLTLRRSMPGPDHAASMSPTAFARMVRGIRDVEAALGCADKNPDAEELLVAAAARKSIHAAKDLEAGQVLKDDMLVCMRPAGGIPPSDWSQVIGHRLSRSLAKGERLTFEALS